MSTVLGIMELCWGDVGLLLSMPRQGLGNSAIASVANDEQLERFRGKWAAMAITEPEAGSDSAAIRTTAVLDGDEYMLNGEKIYVTSGERADLVVVWATLDRSAGRAAIKSFVVERSNPGMKLDRLEHKLGIRASDTAAFILARLPRAAGEPARLAGGRRQKRLRRRDADVRQHASARGRDGRRRGARCLELTRRLLAEAGVEVDWDRPRRTRSPPRREYLAMEADYEAARLLTMEAAWMADNCKPNSLQASMAKAKAGRTCVDVALRCVELCGRVGYGESSCSRSGRATRRSSTSSRARSRSSS